MSYTPDDAVADAEILLPDGQVAEVAIHFIRKVYWRVRHVDLPADRHNWMVVHDADGTFKDRAIHRSVVEHLQKLALALKVPLDRIAHGLAYDGENNQQVTMPLLPFNRDAPGWPRLILCDPEPYDVKVLAAQIIEDVENGGNGDMDLASEHVEEELERDALLYWEDMRVAQRLEMVLAADEGDPLEALCDDGPYTGAVYAELERHVYESS